MASPFKIFRKNAKVLLVGLFLMSMISFVIIPALLEYLGATRGSSTPPVVVTQRFGSLTEQQVDGLLMGQAAVQRFLEALQDYVTRRQGNPMQITMFRQTLGELSEEQVVRLWLLARYAEAAGMAISDPAVNRYIQDLLNSTGVAISPQDLQALMAQQRIDENALFSGMNLALLAIRYAELSGVDPWRFLPGYAGETPGQRWDYFLRLRRMASVELAEIPVEKFAQKVTPPTDAQLRQLFEKYKTRLPQPNSPDPGFKVPEKVRCEYLKGDLAMWLERTSVSEEELRRVYEERKDELFLAPQTSSALPSAATPAGPALPSPQDTSPATTAPPSSESTAPESGDGGQAAPAPSQTMQPESAQPEATAPAEQPGGESGAATAPPSTPQSPGAAENPSTEAPEMPVPETAPESPQEGAPSGTPPESTGDPAPAESAPASEAAPESSQKPPEKPAAEESSDTPAGSTEGGSDQKAPSSSDQSRTESKPVVRLVGFMEESPAQPEESPTSPSESSPAASGDAATAPPAVSPPAVNPPAEPAPGSPPGSTAAPASPPGENPPATTATPKYRPFEEVRDEVRRIIASEQMRAALDKIEEEMRRYQVAYGNYLSAVESAKESKATPPNPPERPNLEEIARREGFQYGKTELLPRWDIEALDIGKSVDSQGVTFAQVIFDLREFLTARTFDVNQNQYLAWPIERVEEHVPEFTDSGVREEVLRAWGLIEGRKLADSECAAFASEAEKSGKTLAEFFAGKDEFKDVRIVPETEPFTWMTYGELDLAWAASRPPFLSSIKAKRKDPASGLVVDEDAVDQPGNDFMAAVFALQPGQVGFAWNQPRSKVYLVRVIEMQPPAAQLYDAFVRQNQQTYMSVSWYDRIEAYSRWSRNLEEQAGLRWNRAPSRAARR
ncbi:MAG: hypothetical protein Kow0040_20410 [Thermogutta sp.]